MIKIDDAVRKETKYIAFWVLIFSAVMQLAFFFSDHWDFTVLWGNLLSGVAVVANFFLMGLTIQKALEKEEKDARNFMKLSQTYRFLFLVAVVAIGAGFFSLWAAIIPVFFPRVAILIRPFLTKNKA